MSVAPFLKFTKGGMRGHGYRWRADTQVRPYGFTGWKPVPLIHPHPGSLAIKGEGDIRKDGGQ
jgi:hypothetical protein